jgi:hypothetical protein
LFQLKGRYQFRWKIQTCLLEPPVQRLGRYPIFLSYHLSGFDDFHNGGDFFVPGDKVKAKVNRESKSAGFCFPLNIIKIFIIYNIHI